MSNVLTMSDFVALEIIVSAAQKGARVRWMPDESRPSVIADGVARAITHEDGNFQRAGEDIRDGYLWISGFREYFIPVRELIDKSKTGMFVQD